MTTLPHNNSTLFWLAAASLPGIGPITFSNWLTVFGDIKTLFAANPLDLANAGLSSQQIQLLKNIDWSSVEKNLMWCEKNKCQIITLADDAYPPLLREIVSAPLVLYVQGDVSMLHAPQLAIVGSRNPTSTGRELAHHFAYTLAKAGLHITSGLALGVDAASHRGALQAGGKTVAVFGTGLKHIYPDAHRSLAEEIRQQGALVSEFSPFQSPKAAHFPQRNRIISGLSLGVLIVEAALRSGSLITARYANEQGRDVFAIPGSIHNPLARGCHHLIRQGAKLVETTEDIIEELGSLHGAVASGAGSSVRSIRGMRGAPPSIVKMSTVASIAKTKNRVTLAPPLRALLAHIGYEITALDTLVARSRLTASEVSSMLLTLELQDVIKAVPGGYQLK